MAQQVVLVLVRREELALLRRRLGADGDHVEARVVGVARLDAAEEVGDAEERRLLLAREVEPAALGGAVVVGPHHEVVAGRVHREVAPRDRGHEPALGLRAVELGAQGRADPRLELVVGLAALGPELPLVAEERGLVDEPGDLVERDALRDTRAEERRREDRHVVGDVGARRHVDRLDGVELGLARRQLAAARRAPEVGIDRARLLRGHQGVHRVETLERVLAVEEAALVDLAQVDLDVVARRVRRRRAAPASRRGRGRSSRAGSRA